MNRGILKIGFDDLLSALNVNGFEHQYSFINHDERYLGIVVEHEDLPETLWGSAIPTLKLNTFWNGDLNFATSVDFFDKQINCTNNHVVNSREDD